MPGLARWKKLFLTVLAIAITALAMVFIRTSDLGDPVIPKFVPKQKKDFFRNASRLFKDVRWPNTTASRGGLLPDLDYTDNLMLFNASQESDLSGINMSMTQIIQLTASTGPKIPLAGNVSKKNGPVLSKHTVDYLVEYSDPRAEKLFQRVLMKMTPNVKKKFLLASKAYEGKFYKPLSSEPIKKRWSFLIKVMKSLGLEQRLPTVINIGVKKSGTNAFGFFITHHPSISHSIGNEVHYFDWNYSKGIEYYRSRMSFSSSDQMSFEKTPRYFVTQTAPLSIKTDLPQPVKFILCVKNPISRVISDFRHESELKLRKVWREKGRSKPKSTEFLEGKKLEALILDKQGNINTSNELVLTSNYLYHMKHWLQYYPLDQFLIVDSEILANNAFAVMKETEKFLGLKQYFKESMFFYDKARGGTCLNVDGKTCPAKSTPGFLPKAKLSPEVMKKLQDYYRPLMKEFSELVGQTFTWYDQL